MNFVISYEFHLIVHSNVEEQISDKNEQVIFTKLIPQKIKEMYFEGVDIAKIDCYRRLTFKSYKYVIVCNFLGYSFNDKKELPDDFYGFKDYVEEKLEFNLVGVRFNIDKECYILVFDEFGTLTLEKSLNSKKLKL